MYVYLNSEPGLYTVGFYKPNGQWQAESDHSSREEAATRVNYLNGAQDDTKILAAIDQAYSAGFIAGQGLKG